MPIRQEHQKDKEVLNDYTIDEDDLIGKAFQLRECSCAGPKTVAVECPDCGTYSCTGARGEIMGVDCKMCEYTYAVQQAITKVRYGVKDEKDGDQ